MKARNLEVDYTDGATKKKYERYRLKQPEERVQVDPWAIDTKGMDVGDYEFIDGLRHCPAIDWRQGGKMHPHLRNQQTCGSCWAHTTVAAVENAYARAKGVTGDDIPALSEQQLVDCCAFPNLGCMGGKAIHGFKYAADYGLTKGEWYPYVNAAGPCQMKQKPELELYPRDESAGPYTLEPAFRIDGYKAYDHILRHDLEKLVCQGAVAVPMKINRCIKHYIAGIIDDSDGLCGCSIGGPNHAVTLVGFGKQIEAGWTAKEGEANGKCSSYWILRNSWTDRWGEGGYFRLCRDDDGIRDGQCLIRSDAVLPIVN